MHLFIGHVFKDKGFALKLSKDLRYAGFNVFSFTESIIPGQSIAERISTEILKSDAFLLILSKHTSKSPWINSEIALALSKKERDQRARIIPLLIDPNIKPLFFIQDLLYLNFSDPEKYHENITNLIKTLQQKQPEIYNKNQARIATKKFIDAKKTSLLFEKAKYIIEKKIRNRYLFTRFGIITGILTILVGASIIIITLTDISLPWLLSSLSFFAAGIIVPVIISHFYSSDIDEKIMQQLRKEITDLISEIDNREVIK